MPLDVSRSEHDGIQVLALRGEIDVSSALALHELFAGELAEGRTRVVVDLTEVPFMDSSGIGALVAGRSDLVAAGGAFAVAAPQPRVLRVLDLTGLTEAFGCLPTAAEACQALA